MQKSKGKLQLTSSSDEQGKLSKFGAFLVAILMTFIATSSAYADAQWTNACVAGLESTGGRGSNAASAYCGCMVKAANDFDGVLAGLLAVMQAPAGEKTSVYQAQKTKNKGIISACVTRVEEVYGVVKPTQAEQAVPQVRGIWGDPEVAQAIRAIGLGPMQAKVFRESATKFSTDMQQATAKIFRDKLDIKRKLKKKRRVLAKRMDAEVVAVLMSAQIPAYEAFSKILGKKMQAQGRSRSGAASATDSSDKLRDKNH